MYNSYSKRNQLREISSSYAYSFTGIYILANPPPPGGKEVFVQIERKGKNLKEDMKKGREKGGERRKKKSDKTHVKIPL